ncbi:hypothetical protein B9479_003442 [Cryptococcus floricola]|uniref:Uncharacterized protein n=1 Tax=Cryptococcus floricola TaxID=2591691 RepID=A0A5D3B098_9TREE|nr:hypothetical protein B9479_003442 [Cryptococcus floricola]
MQHTNAEASSSKHPAASHPRNNLSLPLSLTVPRDNSPRGSRGRSASRRRDARNEPASARGSAVDLVLPQSAVSAGTARSGGGSLRVSERALSPKSGSEAGGSNASRRLRTVPPMAIFEPPTPPPSEQPLPPAEGQSPSAAADPFPTITTASSRAMRYRYSDSSSNQSSADDSSSDETPPWWTFTQRGMARIKHKTLKHKQGQSGKESDREDEGGLTEGVTEAESGREEGRLKKRTSYFSASRKSSKETPGPSGRRTASPSRILGYNRNSAYRADSVNNTTPSLKLSNAFKKGSTTRLEPVATHLRPIKSNHGNESQTFGRRKPPLKRMDSAPAATSSPTSPVFPSSPSPGLTTLVDQPLRDPQAPIVLGGEVSGASPTASPTRRTARRQLTAPAFPRFFRSRDTGTGDEQSEETDHEPSPFARPRPRSTLTSTSIPDPAQTNFNLTPGQDPNDPSNSPGALKYKRKGSHRLRINLPPPLTQHFANNFQNGWPHAGSWQDALYGYYEEPQKMRQGSTPAGGFAFGVTEEGAAGAGTASEGEGGSRKKKKKERRKSSKAPGIQSIPPSPHEGDIESSAEQQQPVTAGGSKRTKAKKQKRFEAMVPPTPSGLGFTPRHSGEGLGEYPWNGMNGENDRMGGSGEKAGNEANEEKLRADQPRGNALALLHPDPAHLRNNANLARHTSRATITDTTVDEHGSNSSAFGYSRGGRNGFRLFGKRQRPNEKRMDLNLSWRKRWKRVLFLDARVTIWVRLINLIVVVIALGLSIQIRLNLISLSLPGVLGSSTTLIISYATTTIFHGLMAIYREYFGKPIGLWGLSSKMLWVCLDLLFVALWSSALSLSINDLIATPLECSAGAAWWRNGLASDYASMIAELEESAEAVANATLADNSSLVTTAISDNLLGVTSPDLISTSLGITLPTSVTASHLARQVCRHQAACIALSLLALLLYGGNMVLSLFRIFETVRRTGNASRAVVV